jgi:hypothetical protein
MDDEEGRHCVTQRPVCVVLSRFMRKNAVRAELS